MIVYQRNIRDYGMDPGSVFSQGPGSGSGSWLYSTPFMIAPAKLVVNSRWSKVKNGLVALNLKPEGLEANLLKSIRFKCALIFILLAISQSMLQS